MKKKPSPMKRNLSSFGSVVSKSISEYSDKSDGVLIFFFYN